MTAAIASAIPSLYLADVEGPNVLVIVYGAEEGSNPWLYELPDPIYSWVLAEADTDATVLPQVISLQSIQMSAGMAALLSMASLSNRPFTTTVTQLGRVIVTTAYPTPTPVHASGLSTGGKIGLGIGVPVFVVLLVAIAFVLFHVRRNRYRSRGVELYDPPAKFQPQSPTVPFPDHNEQNYTGLEVWNFVNGGPTGHSVATGGGPHGTEFVAGSGEMESDHVVNGGGEPKRILQRTPRKSYVQRKPTGSFSSTGVRVMGDGPTAERAGTIAGTGGYLARANDNRIEDEGFADAAEMPAAPVQPTQHASSNDNDKIENANAVKEPEKTERSSAVEEHEKTENASATEESEKMEDANAVEKDENQEASADGQDQTEGVGTAK
jgi:hypothetical protein